MYNYYIISHMVEAVRVQVILVPLCYSDTCVPLVTKAGGITVCYNI